MEKIKVNMSPNPLDVQTIHASQNDGEARQWEFELHNNGELIDTSDVTEQMFFKSYKGGTEQILPENTSTPTTSPFLGDIKYPQGLLTDQEFTYRQSPTEEDGLAKIKSIKGNTLVWNQIFPTQTVNYTGTGYTLTSNNDGKFVLTVTETASQDSSINHAWLPRTTFTPGHKYLLIGSDATHGINVYIKGYYVNMNGIWTAPSAMGANVTFIFNNLPVGTYTIYPQIFDLTQMGLDITDPSDFTSLFPLSYYSYNKGTLLSFNGNGIKTVGKNLIGEMTSGLISTADGVSITSNPYWLYSDFIGCFENEYMWFSANINNRGLFYCYDSSKSFKTVVQVEIDKSYVVIRPKANNIAYVRIGFNVSGASTLVDPSSVETYELQVEYNDHRTEYEPYTSSTLSLPISTYFPNGMDGIGSDYDELTNTKATTRMARVDLGTLDYIYEPQNTRFYTSGLANIIKNQGQYDLPNIIVPNYTVRYVYQISAENNMSVGVSSTSGAVFFSNVNYTSGTDFKTAMSGVILVYPLATSTETSFTTASLVTENAEIPLSNDDGVLIGKCTEELSAEPGFHDAKIKLSDSDGTCYSNKLQLHIERSPQ